MNVKFLMYKQPTVMILVLVVLFFSSCHTSPQKTVSLETTYLPGFTKEGKLKQLVSVDDTLKVAYVERHALMFYNTKTHVIDSVQIDPIPLDIKNLDVIDVNTFAFSTKDSVFIYQNGHFSRLRPQLPQNVIMSNHDLFAFFPQERKLVLEVVDYNDKGKGLLENNYLYQCDYLGISTPIDLIPDIEYRTYNLGGPRIYYSKFSKGLVLGMEFSKYVHKLTFFEENVEVQSTPLAGPFDVNTLFVATSNELTDKMDNMFLRLNYNNFFGKVFFNEEKNQLIRLYDFPVSDKKIDGRYLGGKNKKKGFLTQGEKEILHTLPSNRYFDRSQWYYYNNTFYYLKWNKNNMEEVYYLLDKVQIHNY